MGEMALIDERAGCKVAWATYDNEAEAMERSKVEAERRERKAAEGYDFGYQWPGSVEHKTDHPDHGECWIVVCA